MIWLYFVECDAVSVSCSEAMFVILVETVIIFVHILLGFWTQWSLVKLNKLEIHFLVLSKLTFMQKSGLIFHIFPVKIKNIFCDGKETLVVNLMFKSCWWSDFYCERLHSCKSVGFKGEQYFLYGYWGAQNEQVQVKLWDVFPSR